MPTGQQIIVGGESVQCVSSTGEPSTVFVRQLRPSELGAYVEAEAKGELFPLILTTGLGLEELDDISLDSIEALIEADARQNFTHARRHEKRRAAVVERQLDVLRVQSPEAYAKMQDAVCGLWKSPASSPVSPPQDVAGVPPPR